MSQAYEAMHAGGFVWNKQSVTAMIVSALGTAGRLSTISTLSPIPQHRRKPKATLFDGYPL